MYKNLVFVLVMALCIGCGDQDKKSDDSRSKPKGGSTSARKKTKETHAKNSGVAKTTPQASDKTNQVIKNPKDEDRQPTAEEKRLLKSQGGTNAPEGLYLLTRHPNGRVRYKAIHRLLDKFPDDPRINDFFLKLLNEENSKVRQSAFLALARFYGKYGKARTKPPKVFMKSIIEGVSDAEFSIRSHAAQLVGLYSGEPEASKTIPILIKLAKNYDDSGFAAIRSLGLLGAESELMKLYQTEKFVNVEIALAMATVNPASEKVVEILRKEIAKEGSLESEYCELIDALGTVRPSRKACVVQLEKATESKVESIRQHAIAALAKIAPGLHDTTIPILEKIANDPASPNKELAKNALDEIKSNRKKSK